MIVAMKKIYALFAVLMVFTLQACAQEKWIENTHYKVLPTAVSESPEVTEFFSFWCPHCFAFEPIAAKIKSQLPSDVKFNKVHVNFMRFTTTQIQNDVTRAQMLARAMNEEDSLNAAIFNFIHLQRGNINGLDDVKQVFINNGVKVEEFDALISSEKVDTLYVQSNETMMQYRNYVNGVPSFIVNGKYLAIHTRDMTPDDFVDLVVWLTQLP